MQAHEELSGLAKRRAESDWKEGRGLLAAFRAGVHRHLGFASFAQYVESLFGYKPRSVEEKLRVAEALERLPLLSSELREGRLRWSAARELTRVASAETEKAWHELARGKTVRQLEDSVAGRRCGDMPDSPADPNLRTHRLAFEVCAETLATFREAVAKLRRDAGEPLDEETALLLMARHVLGGPTDDGRASYQISMTLCEQCKRGFQHGRGQQLEVDSHVVEMATCDAQYIGRVDPPSSSADLGGGVSERPHESEEACAHVGGRASGEASAHVGGRASGEACAHVGGRESAEACDQVGERAGAESSGQGRGVREARGARRDRTTKQRQPSARQAVPPAVRRLVLHRDGKRCVVPGCSHAVFLDLHHLDLRSEGGGHEPDSLVTLCSAHHRALHRGSLIIEGRSVTALVFRHADGSAYRGAVSARAASAHQQAFAALRGLGFREGDVKKVLARLWTEVGLDSGSVEEVVRAALRVLTAATCGVPNLET